MRAALVLLTVSALVSAQEEGAPEIDPFFTRLQEFERARVQTLQPGAQGVVNPAVEGLLGTKDVRAVQPLATYLVETMQMNDLLEEQSKAIQKRAFTAYERMQSIDRELQLLRIKERAGDPSAGPEIAKRIEERQRQERVFEAAKSEVGQLGRQTDFVSSTREKLADGLAKLLAALEGDAARAGMAELCKVFDVAQREQALYCVRILRSSSHPAAEEYLLTILTHPKPDDAVVRATVHALVPVLTARGARSLIALWESSPETMADRVRHVLGLKARRSLQSLDAARAWVATIEE